MLRDYLLSLVRTAVPAAVGGLLTWLAARWGIVLDEKSSAEAMALATALAVAAYYALVRALETRWPWFGKLLGTAQRPAYGRGPQSTLTGRYR